jgi:hypothetical protein
VTRSARARTARYVVMTSIHDTNPVMRAYASLEDWRLILVGDRKGPACIDDDRIEFLDLASQVQLGFETHALTPENHYARKNLGYLHAMSLGAEIIAETDDDNLPKPGWGRGVAFQHDHLKTLGGSDFVNVYAEFTGQPAWPRGFPLERLSAAHSPTARRLPCRIGIWQHLADDSPDVDAIHRLVFAGDLVFDDAEPFALCPHTYCPFNSQNTFWSRPAFALLYLPTTVSFRFTDILRGYVAQRLLWQRDLLLGFAGASVRQDRNPHDLMRDFRDEIPVYTRVLDVVSELEDVRLPEDPLDGLAEIYGRLAKRGIVRAEELRGVEAWSRDVRELGCA